MTRISLKLELCWFKYIFTWIKEPVYQRIVYKFSSVALQQQQQQQPASLKQAGSFKLYTALPAGLWRWPRGCVGNGWRCYPGAAPVYSAGHGSLSGGWESGCPSTGQSWRPLGNGKASWSAPTAADLRTQTPYLKQEGEVTIDNPLALASDTTQLLKYCASSYPIRNVREKYYDCCRISQNTCLINLWANTCSSLIYMTSVVPRLEG